MRSAPRLILSLLIAFIPTHSSSQARDPSLNAVICYLYIFDESKSTATCQKTNASISDVRGGEGIVKYIDSKNREISIIIEKTKAKSTTMVGAI